MLTTLQHYEGVQLSERTSSPLYPREKWTRGAPAIQLAVHFRFQSCSSRSSWSSWTLAKHLHYDIAASTLRNSTLLKIQWRAPLLQHVTARQYTDHHLPSAPASVNKAMICPFSDTSRLVCFGFQCQQPCTSFTDFCRLTDPRYYAHANKPLE